MARPGVAKERLDAQDSTAARLPNGSAPMMVVASPTSSRARRAARRTLAHIGTELRLYPVLCKAGISIDTCGAVHQTPPLSGLAPLVVIYASQMHDGCSIRRKLPGQEQRSRARRFGGQFIEENT